MVSVWYDFSLLGLLCSHVSFPMVMSRFTSLIYVELRLFNRYVKRLDAVCWRVLVKLGGGQACPFVTQYTVWVLSGSGSTLESLPLGGVKENWGEVWYTTLTAYPAGTWCNILEDGVEHIDTFHMEPSITVVTRYALLQSFEQKLKATCILGKSFTPWDNGFYIYERNER